MRAWHMCARCVRTANQREWGARPNYFLSLDVVLEVEGFDSEPDEELEDESLDFDSVFDSLLDSDFESLSELDFARAPPLPDLA